MRTARSIVCDIADQKKETIMHQSARLVAASPGSEHTYIIEVIDQIKDNRALAVALFTEDIVKAIESVKGGVR